MNLPRPEHPRPDFYRPRWLNLNGTWEFAFFGLYPVDDAANYVQYFRDRKLPQEIIVPFPYQSPLSGIGQQGIQPCVWYRRYFDLPADWQGARVLLHFGAVDYEATVWCNDTLLGVHRGGHTPFTFELTDYLRDTHNALLIKVMDPLDVDQPRGKQSWCDPVACWYTQTTGIWQTVWLEAVPAHYVQSVRIVPDLEDGSVLILARPDAPAQGFDLLVEMSFDGQAVGSVRRPAAYPLTQIRLRPEAVLAWTPETPNLYDVRLSLMEGETRVDTVDTYVGFRKVGLSSRMLLLNNQSYYQRLVLDQGFWPDGLYTPPSDDALQADIVWAKKMGFNGCRKHMKVEDPRFLFWADKLGFLVWGEFPANYEHSLSGEAKFLPEWQAAMQRDLNHPCIVAWTPFNESWGVKDVNQDPETQRWVRDVVQQTRLIDPTRLVIDNDGWFHLDSDIYGYHDYAATGDDLRTNYDRARSGQKFGWAGDPRVQMMAGGLKLPAKPIMLTEFGGIGFRAGATQANAWGYADIPQNVAEFQQRYEATFRAVFNMPELCGYVYTQLTDVQQEINGLLTADRQPKFDVDWLRQVNQTPVPVE